MTRFGLAFKHWRTARFVALLTVFVVGAIAAVHVFERMLLNQVQEVTETANVAFTRIFVNEAWGELRPMMDMEANTHPRDNPSLRDVDMRVRRFTKGTDLVKVKIYNMQGLTLYSSDPAQLGENKASNKGFQTASQGRVASETNYRGKFGAFDGELYQRNMVSSYVPVKGNEGLEAVVEVYADRTTSVEGVNAEIRTAWTYFGPGTGVAFIFVLLLFQSDRRDRTIRTATTVGEGAQGLSDISDPDTPTALLREATQVLSADREQLERALLAHHDSTPVSEAWRAISVPLQSLLSRIDELALIQKPEQPTALSTSTGQQPLGELVESAMAAFRGRSAEQDIALSGHVAPALAHQNPGSTQILARLVDLMLDEASRRTGRGMLRLNIQPSADGTMQIEVVGTRSDGEATPHVANAIHSLTLSAARSLARALNGSIERASDSSRGPWITAKLPLRAGAKAL
jgi:hypothetical protein